MGHNTGRTLRILYVEDEKKVQEALSRILELSGYEVACADNGKLGVEKAKCWQPDIILMDVRMPVMDGIEATRCLRRNLGTAKIPIVVLSAYTDAATHDSCEKAGVDEFLAKPASIGDINSIIQKVLKTEKT